MRDALFAAGAGRIGDYERCSWYTEGTGTFFGGEGAEPAVGERGQEERVPELRLETVYPAEREAEVVRACARRIRTRSPRSTSTSCCEGAALHGRRRRGNPGPAAYAYVLETDDGTVLAAHGEAIGVATNNVAEYRALVEGLKKAAEVGVDELEVVSDSQLVVEQMRGSTRSRTSGCASSGRKLRASPTGWGRCATRPFAASTTSSPTGSSTRPSTQLIRNSRLYSEGYADVAQLARASCHAEGRGFESHHPLHGEAALWLAPALQCAQSASAGL